jgi:hypothetical protein
MASPVSHGGPVYLPKSYRRKVRNIWHKIVYDFFRSVKKRWSHINMTLPKTLPESPDNPNLGVAIHKLFRTRVIGDSVLQAYQTYLKPKTDLQLFMSYDGRLPRQPSKGKLLAIPVVVKGLFVNHVMCVVVDFQNKRIEFYDPQGLTVEDRAKDRLSRSTISLKQFMDKVCSTYGFDTVVENTQKHQGDCHSCGIHVLDYIERRSSGKSCEELFDKGRTFEDVNSSVRHEMIKKLLGHTE